MKKEETAVDYAEAALVAKLQDNMGLSEAVAQSIVWAMYDYIYEVAQERAQDALDRKFNEGDYRG